MRSCVLRSGPTVQPLYLRTNTHSTNQKQITSLFFSLDTIISKSASSIVARTRHSALDTRHNPTYRDDDRTHIVHARLPRRETNTEVFVGRSQEQRRLSSAQDHPIEARRHGQSMGNVDESAYVTTADWRIPLTEIGVKQAYGEQLVSQS
jgi:hypothetical protein